MLDLVKSIAILLFIPLANEFADCLVTRNIAKMQPGRSSYVLVCDEDGMVVPPENLVGRRNRGVSDRDWIPSLARVDRDMGISALSSEKNTSGFLNLIAFPDDENSLSGSDVTGSFEFETEDLKSQKVTVKGKFCFKVK